MKSLFKIPLASCAVQTWSGGPSFAMVYDSDKAKMKIEASVPDGQYLSIAYGRGMSNIDMVFFPGSSSDLLDLYSVSYSTPSTDSSNDYVDTEKVTSNGVHSYVTYR